MTPSIWSMLQTRRQFFARSASGIGVAALASMLPRESVAGGPALGVPHFTPRAKNVIYLFMNGAPPHLDTFDYKPQMEKYRGKEIPESIHKGQRVSTMTQGQKRLTLPPYPKFHQHGMCGAWVCDFLPHT